MKLIKRTLTAQATPVRYKDPEFEQIVSSLRHQTGGRQLVFMGMQPLQMKLAARAIALRLGKQFYAVDMGTVISKYIGETEKNLGRILDTASTANWILFFDEADALFGKRTEIRDSHDKYANQETSYLLQKLEQHRGITIFATQRNSGLDIIQKYLKRRKLVVKFPPDGLRRTAY